MTFNREDTWVCVAFFLPLSLEEGLVADSTGCCEFLLSHPDIQLYPGSLFLFSPAHRHSVPAHSTPLLETVDEKPFAFLREGFSRFLRVEEFLSAHLG